MFAVHEASSSFFVNFTSWLLFFSRRGIFKLRMILNLRLGGVDVGGYQTLQRKALVDFLYRHPGLAFTAQGLAKALKEDPVTAQTVGESTVYRLLQKLTAQGLLKRYLSEGSRCYVYEMTPRGRSCDGHLHLKCIRCHKLIHLGEEETSRITRETEKQGFSLDKGQTLLIGQCAACREELS